MDIIEIDDDKFHSILPPECIEKTEEEDEDALIVFYRNLHPRVTEELLFELFLQAGPLISVTIPVDEHGYKRRYGFVKFKHRVSVPYCLKLFKGVKLFGQELYLNVRKRQNDAIHTAEARNSMLANQAYLQYYQQLISNQLNYNYNIIEGHDALQYSGMFLPNFVNSAADSSINVLGQPTNVNLYNNYFENLR